jgi:hypothetical protein
VSLRRPTFGEEGGVLLAIQRRAKVAHGRFEAFAGTFTRKLLSIEL